MVRRMSQTSAFIQFDNLSDAKLDRVRPAAFLTHSDEPRQYQEWIAVHALKVTRTAMASPRLKKQITADSAATDSVRLVGSS
jgi:hypothetical protein